MTFIHPALNVDTPPSILTHIGGLSFTQREIDVMACIMNGRTSKKAISLTLSISPGTVASHTRNIMQKLQCSSWEHIRDFVERSGHLPSLHAHFKTLRIQDQSTRIEIPRIGVQNRSNHYGVYSTDPSQRQRFVSGPLSHLKQHRYPIWAAAIVLTLVLIIGVTNHFNRSRPRIHSELTIPPSNVLLPRESCVRAIKEKLARRINDTIPLVGIVGMGGAGKTLIARMVGHEYKNEMVWELNAQNMPALRTSFRELADALAQTKEQKDRIDQILQLQQPDIVDKKILAFVKEHLKATSRWVLIFDNVASPSDLNAYIPQDAGIWGKGRVIVTSRNGNIKDSYLFDPNNIFQIDALTQEESFTLLSKIVYGSRILSTNEKTKALEFLTYIPPFPLDILVTAHYIKNTQTTYDEYLERMQQQNFHMTQEAMLQETHHYTQTRHGLITLSLQQVIDKHPEFSDLLLMVCLLEDRTIPRALLDRLKGKLIVDAFVMQMKKHSLMSQESSGEQSITLSIPRVTQTIGLRYLTQILSLQTTPSRITALAQLLERYTNEMIDSENTAHLHLLTPHVARFIHSDLIPESSRGALTCLLGGMYYYLGEDTNAQATLQSGIRTLQASPAGNEVRLANALSYLGDTYKNKGQYTEAATALERSVALHSKVDSNSIRLARTLSYLGNTYRFQGHYGKAISTLQHSLSIYKKHPNHTASAAQASAVLGVVHRDLGDYKKAKDMLEKSQAVSMHNRHYKMWSIGIGLCLGSVYTALGDPSKARAVLERELEREETTYSKDHALYGWVLTYLGDAYRHLNHPEKARELLNKAVDTFNKNYTLMHYGMIVALSKLGALYTDLGDIKQATSVLNQSIALVESHFGSKHFQAAFSLNNLGKIAFLEGDLERAEDLLNQSFKAYEGVNHSDMYIPLETLGNIYVHKGTLSRNLQDITGAFQQEKRARDYFIRALDIVNVRFTPESPHAQQLQQALERLSKTE